MAKLLLTAFSLANVAFGSFQAPNATNSSASEAAAGKTKDDYLKEKADAAAAEAAKKAEEAKKAAFNKVVTMLDNLQKEILDEGEKEAATYNKFACFCKDTTKEKVAAIDAGKDDKATVETNIEKLALKRDELDEAIADAQTAIEGAEAEMKEAESNRADSLATYERNAADLKSALTSLANAIKELKASAKPSLLQLKSVQESVRPALVLADALDLGSESTKRAGAMLLEQPMQDYDFHSGDIIAMLEKLNDDFRAESADLDAEEVKSVAAHDAFMQEKTDFVKLQNNNLDKAQKHKEETSEALGAASEELSTLSATLMDDQQYLQELSDQCHHKAITWDQRSKLRADEIAMLKSVMDILHNTIDAKTNAGTIRFIQGQAVTIPVAEAIARDSSSMEDIEAGAELIDSQQAPMAFVQRSLRSAVARRHVAAAPDSGDDDVKRQLVASFLAKGGRDIKSTLLLSLSRRMSVDADPFVKIKKLIQELIERLLQEAANEGNQKAWCDKATKDAEQKRDYAAEAVSDLNAEMAGLEALRDKLDEEFNLLTQQIGELTTSRNEEESERAEESAENAATVQAAKEGLEAVNTVLDILEKFYATAQKETVSFAQGRKSKGPMDDAPDAGFDNGEANTGNQGTATGIIGMFEVMQGDFQRTIAETEYAETQAKQDYLKFMTETGMSLEAKKTADKEKRSYHQDALDKLAAADQSLVAEVDAMKSAILELLDLKPVCVDTGMSYEERVARREDEIKMLNKALCLLDTEGTEGGC